VWKRCAADHDAQRVHDGKVRLGHSAGNVLLLEHDFAVLAVLQAPALHVPLQRAQLAFLISTGIGLAQ
jgi:hypothetical protein